MVSDKNYITIQGWMIKMNLTPSELILYALIYGFSQDGESEFKGSIQYMSEWLNVSTVTVSNNLNKLIEKGLVQKIKRPGHTSYLKAISKNTIVEESENNKKDISVLSFDNYKPALKNKDYKVLSDEERFELDKNKKDIRTLMYWTNQLIENSSLKDALINWLKLMQVNNKYQTLSLYKEKLQLLLDMTSSDEEAIEVVKDTTDKGYFTFKYSLDGLKKNGKTFSNQNLYNPYKEN